MNWSNPISQLRRAQLAKVDHIVVVNHGEGGVQEFLGGLVEGLAQQMQIASSA